MGEETSNAITSDEYDKETLRILMGDVKYPTFGYKPINIRDRIEKLLRIEKFTLRVCESKSFGRGPCPYCGYHHK